ncbi:MAG: hypothetical protein IBX64_03810 [Actinobacteria bacterium]|nr:hypothetical protein [Actinomycetota bacterium]
MEPLDLDEGSLQRIKDIALLENKEAADIIRDALDLYIALKIDSQKQDGRVYPTTPKFSKSWLTSEINQREHRELKDVKGE